MRSTAPSAPVVTGLSRVARAVRFWVLSDYGRCAFGSGFRHYLPYRASSRRSLPDLASGRPCGGGGSGPAGRAGGER